MHWNGRGVGRDFVCELLPATIMFYAKLSVWDLQWYRVILKYHGHCNNYNVIMGNEKNEELIFCTL